jgi:hypothetical protein
MKLIGLVYSELKHSPAVKLQSKAVISILRRYVLLLLALVNHGYGTSEIHFIQVQTAIINFLQIWLPWVIMKKL